MEPPSTALVETLAELRLATPRDWRRAARPCRRLACDLPTFDEVWIDALLRLRILTRFQAEELRAGRGKNLLVGRYVLCERLGRSAESSTFAAKPLIGGAAVAIKILSLPPSLAEESTDRLQRLIAAGATLRSRTAIVPHDLVLDNGSRVLISRLAEGIDARSLLMRRGNLPAHTVCEIAQQLVASLDELHRCGIVHGELSLDSLRLTEGARCSLVDGGVRACFAPAISVQDGRSADAYAGIAPERIGTSAPATLESDLYALGCVLWHLLAGRPPFPRGDRLAALAAHRSKPVPCVRDFADDVPMGLARAVSQMTAFDPAERPTDLAELQQRLRVEASGRSLFRPTAHRRTPNAFPWVAAAVLLMTLAGAAVSFADRDAFSTLLAMRPNAFAASRRIPVPDQSNSSQRLATMPAPDAKGVIRLDHPGPFAAMDVTQRGALVLRGRAERPAVIIVKDGPLHLWADEVTLENVSIVSSSQSALSASTALALIESQNLTVRSCRFESPQAVLSEQAAEPIAIAWRRIDRADPTSGQIEFADCVARNVRDLVFLSESPRKVRLSNVLQVKGQSLFAVKASDETPIDFELSQITLREVKSVIRSEAAGRHVQLNLTAADSILDLVGDALCSAENDTGCRVNWHGSGVVTTQDVTLLASAKPLQQASLASSDSGLLKKEPEGVAVGQVVFRGAAQGADANSSARVSGVPRRADRPVGVEVARLPAGTVIRGTD
jgi:serine/threonine protein kinase